jgi:hypothetical protein
MTWDRRIVNNMRYCEICEPPQPDRPWLPWTRSVDRVLHPPLPRMRHARRLKLTDEVPAFGCQHLGFVAVNILHQIWAIAATLLAWPLRKDDTHKSRRFALRAPQQNSLTHSHLLVVCACEEATFIIDTATINSVFGFGSSCPRLDYFLHRAVTK